MEKQELIVAAVIALVATLPAVGLYLWLFDLSTGRLKTGVARAAAKAVADAGDFLRRRLWLVLAVLALAVVILLAAWTYQLWSRPIRGLIGGDSGGTGPLETLVRLVGPAGYRLPG